MILENLKFAWILMEHLDSTLDSSTSPRHVPCLYLSFCLTLCNSNVIKSIKLYMNQVNFKHQFLEELQFNC